MRRKNVVCVAIIILLALIGLAHYNHLRGVEGLSSTQQDQMYGLRVDLNRLVPGDMVTIDGETYMVHRLSPPSSAYLSGPGPMSHLESGRFLEWGTSTAVRGLMDAQTTIRHREDQDWQQLATWYYLQ